MGIASLHPSYDRHTFAISRRAAPEVCNFVAPPLKQRAQGRPGARCTRGLACQMRTTKRTRAYRFSGNTPAFPAQWLYGLLRALPGERLFCHRRPPRSLLLRDLTPAPRRQDHTTSPYASRHPRQSWRPRPPQPVPTFVTMANAPLAGQDAAIHSGDLPDGLSGKFFAEGLDNKSSDLPVRHSAYNLSLDAPSSRPVRNACGFRTKLSVSCLPWCVSRLPHYRTREFATPFLPFIYSVKR